MAISMTAAIINPAVVAAKAVETIAATITPPSSPSIFGIIHKLS